MSFNTRTEIAMIESATASLQQSDDQGSRARTFMQASSKVPRSESTTMFDEQARPRSPSPRKDFSSKSWDKVKEYKKKVINGVHTSDSGSRRKEPAVSSANSSNVMPNPVGTFVPQARAVVAPARTSSREPEKWIPAVIHDRHRSHSQSLSVPPAVRHGDDCLGPPLRSQSNVIDRKEVVIHKDRTQIATEHKLLPTRSQIECLQLPINHLPEGKVIIERSELDTLHARIEQMSLEMTKWQTIVAKNRPLIRHQSEDDFILSQYQALFLQIRNWSGRFSVERAIDKDSSNIGHRRLHDFCRIAPNSQLRDFASFWSNIGTRNLFIRAWVGLLACNMMRRNACPGEPGARMDRFLGSQVAKSLLDLENFIAVNTGANDAEIHLWRATSIHLLLKDESDHLTLTEEMEEYVCTEVEYVVSFIKTWSDYDESKLRGQLEAIFHQAIALSRLLRQQRATWSIEYPFADELDLGLEYLEVIGSIGRRAEPDVVLVVQPVFYKVGDAHGTMYDIPSVMQRAEVVVR